MSGPERIVRYVNFMKLAVPLEGILDDKRCAKVYAVEGDVKVCQALVMLVDGWGRGGGLFDFLDRNHDGSITRSESGASRTTTCRQAHRRSRCPRHSCRSPPHVPVGPLR